VGFHYLPQYYLRGFGELPDCSHVWLYEKGSQRFSRAAISKVAQKRRYYTDEIESWLATQIEDPGNAILKKLRGFQGITQSEKETLARYIVVMQTRVPRERERKEKGMPEMLDRFSDDFQKSVIEALMKEYPENELLETRANEVRKVIAKWKTEGLPRDFRFELMQPHCSPVRVQVLSKMTWQFLRSAGGLSFLTSDNPVFFCEDLGIRAIESELSFPISRDIALHATWRRDLPEGFVRVPRQVIKEINRRTVSAATRFVFHSAQEDWVLTLVNKKKYTLNRIRS